MIAASARHTASVIFLHGLGDTGFGWESAIQGWVRSGKLDHVQWVLPHAPRIPITAVCNKIPIYLPFRFGMDIGSLLACLLYRTFAIEG